MTASKSSTPPEQLPRQISYNIRQAAEATGISESRLRALVRHGHIAARYLGSTVLVDAESLARFYRSLPSERQTGRECAANRTAPGESLTVPDAAGVRPEVSPQMQACLDEQMTHFTAADMIPAIRLMRPFATGNGWSKA
ncbi:helix-turn-helix domain-containing protein [Nocardia neocaledoniensis]|uniref:helix-turn-helix domain-containing protein n=1 Tax=Nocardia neocaledoniensis TaxID=236511 RepID=UPI0024586C28|nr:helix-turn-helix domain-containing protein [Nocardia neocaledoniensis]